MSVIEIEKPTTRSSTVIGRSPAPTRPQLAPRSLRTHAPARNPADVPRYPEIEPTYAEPAISQPLVVRKRRVRLAEGVRNLLWKSAFLTGVFVCGYVGATLSGQVMVESARRQEINARERSVNALRAEATLRKHVYALMDREEIDRWASTHGFVAPDSMLPAKPSAEETGMVADKGEEPSQ